MKILLITFIVAISIIFGCTQKNHKNQTHPISQKEDTIFVQYIDTFLLGDINGDQVLDTAFQFSPFFINPSDTSFNGTKDGNCDVTIHFSCAIDSIISQGNLWGEVYPLSDLNKDGYAEILVHPKWFIGCWESLQVYNFNGKSWKMVGNVRFFGCQDEDYNYTDHVITAKGKTYLTGEEPEEGEDGHWKKVKEKLKF